MNGFFLIFIEVMKFLLSLIGGLVGLACIFLGMWNLISSIEDNLRDNLKSRTWIAPDLSVILKRKTFWIGWAFIIAGAIIMYLALAQAPI